jgi:hypothetical protein
MNIKIFCRCSLFPSWSDYGLTSTLCTSNTASDQRRGREERIMSDGCHLLNVKSYNNNTCTVSTSVHCIFVTLPTQDPAFCTRFNHLPAADLKHLSFYISLTVHLGIILVNNLLDALFECIYLFHFSTCFEQPSAHHQENQLYQYIIWYISLCVGDCLVCRSGG